MLGRTKDQIRTTEQVNAALTTCQTLQLDGLVIIGGTSALTSDFFLLYLFFQFIDFCICRSYIQHRCCSACRNVCCCRMLNEGI